MKRSLSTWRTNREGTNPGTPFICSDAGLNCIRFYIVMILVFESVYVMKILHFKVVLQVRIWKHCALMCDCKPNSACVDELDNQRT